MRDQNLLHPPATTMDKHASSGIVAQQRNDSDKVSWQALKLELRQSMSHCGRTIIRAMDFWAMGRKVKEMPITEIIPVH